MIPTDSPMYQKAFEQYLRRGTPMELSLKRMMKAAETSASHTTTHYIWRTAGDDKVRPSHAANEGKIIAWDKPPDTGHPGEDFNCRCKAVAYVPEPGLDGVYPELLLVPGGFFVRRIGSIILERVLRRNEQPPTVQKPAEPRLDDTKTWPTPPKAGRFKEGYPSRSKPRARGEKSLYDEKGGEWRYAPKDKYHDKPHWDYKPVGKAQEWQNISIDGQRIFK